jgi:hypothetical protein
VTEDYAYLADEGVLNTYDLQATEQKQLRKVGTYRPVVPRQLVFTPLPVFVTSIPLFVTETIVPGRYPDYVVAIENHLSDTISNGRISILDATEPTQLTAIDSFGLADLNAVDKAFAIGDHLFVSAFPTYGQTDVYTLQISEKGRLAMKRFSKIDGSLYAANSRFLYFSDTSTFTIYQVGSSGRLTRAGAVPYANAASSGVREVVLVDGYAFVAKGKEGLFVIDVTDPTRPMLVKHIRF